jgi:uncharacterized membrane protein YdfJ with MMPL/SSD domain
MAGASPFEPESAAAPEQSMRAQSPRKAFAWVARTAGFWTAVVLPVVLLVLFASGFVAAHPYASVGLLAANTAGLVLGRQYER